MPGRRGSLGSNGQWNGTGGSNNLPANLTISTRSGNTPSEYKATIDIQFVGEFASGDGDSFEAFITTDDGSGGTGIGISSDGSGYRYGFNGKENDNEVKGEGNQQDYGMRIHNPRLGRFLSLDPITSQYPELTPYQFASNTPIQAADLDGLEADFSKGKMKKREYSSNPFTWFGTFGHNITASGWNSVVGSTETSANAFTSKGREKIKGQVGQATMRTFFWLGGKSNNEKLSDVKDWASNPHTYEDIFANYLLGRSANNVLQSTLGPLSSANSGRLTIPQGLNEQDFKVMSQRVINRVGNITDDIVVQGSRAKGTASIVSDIDVAVKVNSKQFDLLIIKSFGNPNVNSAKWKTMQHAIKTGKIQAGEAGLRDVRKNLEKLLGMDVDISIIKKGGPFDNGTQIPITGTKAKQ